MCANDSLCIDCIKANCIKASQIITDNVCAQTASAKKLFAEDETVNNLCVSGKVQAKQSWSDQSYNNSLCATNATLTNACISNLTASNFTPCVKYRATATFTADSTYTLGNNINWDLVLDDPNNNVALAPFSYTVPASGYYALNFHLKADSLTGSSVISGNPVGLLTLSVNGIPLQQSQVPFLSFVGTQNANLNALVMLNAGDLIRMKYEVLVLDPVSGLINFPGTISIQGSGATQGFSRFSAHYLSSLDCDTSTVLCAPCPQVTIPCNTFVNPCMPLTTPPPSIEPCESCE